jgi:hypothetical protein
MIKWIVFACFLFAFIWGCEMVPLDSTPPEFLNVHVYEVGSSSATVSATYDETALTAVEYGTTTSYGTIVDMDWDSPFGGEIYATIGQVVLDDLTSKTTYHFRVRATDKSENEGISPDYTFVTK